MAQEAAEIERLLPVACRRRVDDDVVEGMIGGGALQLHASEAHARETARVLAAQERKQVVGRHARLQADAGRPRGVRTCGFDIGHGWEVSHELAAIGPGVPFEAFADPIGEVTRQSLDLHGA